MGLLLSDDLNSVNPFDFLKSLLDAPTEFDQEMLEFALEIITQDFPSKAIFTDRPNAEYDPTEGNVKNYEPLYYLETICPPQDFEQKYIDGDNIVIGDTWTIIAASGLEFTPKMGMIATFDSAEWSIVRVSELRGSNVTIAYILQLRK